MCLGTGCAQFLLRLGKCLEATDPEHMFKYFPSQDTLMWEKDAGPAGTMEADWA